MMIIPPFLVKATLDSQKPFMQSMKILLILLLSCTLVFAQDQWKNVYTESAWADRDRWQKADDLIRLLELQPEHLVADVGCHEGYLTMKLSKVVSKGKVLAVDIESERLASLKTHLQQRQITNVEIIKGTGDDPHLPIQKLDAVVILDAYHEMSQHQEVLSHIKASLKKNGRLLICEPIADERRTLSRAGQQAKHEVGLDFVLEDLRSAGFKVLYQKDPFVDRTQQKGDKMWVVVARPLTN